MSYLLCNKIVCCHSFKLFRIGISPCMEILSGQGNCFSKGNKKLRNIFLKNGSDFFSHGFISLCLTAIDIKHKSRMNFAVHRFCGATETDLSGLMCSAGGRASGNMDLKGLRPEFLRHGLLLRRRAEAPESREARSDRWKLRYSLQRFQKEIQLRLLSVPELFLLLFR